MVRWRWRDVDTGSSLKLFLQGQHSPAAHRDAGHHCSEISRRSDDAYGHFDPWAISLPDEFTSGDADFGRLNTLFKHDLCGHPGWHFNDVLVVLELTVNQPSFSAPQGFAIGSQFLRASKRATPIEQPSSMGFTIIEPEPRVRRK